MFVLTNLLIAVSMCLFLLSYFYFPDDDPSGIHVIIQPKCVIKIKKVSEDVKYIYKNFIIKTLEICFNQVIFFLIII